MKKFIVFGLGISGVCAVKFLLTHGYQVIAADDDELSLLNLKQEIKNNPQLKKNLKICQNILEIDWQNISSLLLSPGVALKYPQPHKIVQLAQKNNCPIIGDIELLYLFNQKPNYIGITGTNGKSTTTALIYHVFKENNINGQIGGNIGHPCLEMSQPNSTNKDSYIIEISSYQLDLIKKTRFNISSLLNITNDHLERHQDINGYIKAKKRIFLNQKAGDFAVINIDNSHCQTIYEELKNNPDFTATLIAISTKTILPDGISVINNIIYNNIKHKLKGSLTQINLGNTPFLKGEHNAENIAIAFANCFLSKIDENKIIDALKSFKGLKHRMQLVGKINNINFINDSKATNAESTKHALKTYENIYWILGGRAKNNGIKDLENYFSKVKYAFLIGEATTEFSKILANKVKYYQCRNLQNAFDKACQKAQEDQSTQEDQGTFEKNILLSPACSSFDQWKNFEERGNYFCKLVKLFKN